MSKYIIHAPVDKIAARKIHELFATDDNTKIILGSLICTNKSALNARLITNTTRSATMTVFSKISWFSINAGIIFWGILKKKKISLGNLLIIINQVANGNIPTFKNVNVKNTKGDPRINPNNIINEDVLWIINKLITSE